MVKKIVKIGLRALGYKIQKINTNHVSSRNLEFTMEGGRASKMQRKRVGG